MKRLRFKDVQVKTAHACQVGGWTIQQSTNDIRRVWATTKTGLRRAVREALSPPLSPSGAASLI